MVTQLPSTGASGGGAVICDTSDLIMIHGMYRKVFSDAPALVRAVVPGNSDQRTAVIRHLGDISASLHEHHHGEDDLLWDQLTSRAPACAAHVGQMKQQHAVVAALLEQLDTAVAAWDGTPQTQESVARILDEIRSTLFAHLGQEETDIVPVAQTSMPQDLWNKLGEHGRGSVPANRRLINLGHILSSMPPAEAEAWMKATLPAPIRLLWRLVGKRQFEAEARAMRAAA